MYRIEELPEPIPETAQLPAGEHTTVVLATAAHAALQSLGSSAVEQGGFLLGHVFRDAADPDRHLVQVLDALPVPSTDATPTRFIFPGESFLSANETVARTGGQRRLVGWYHTHPGGAGAGLTPSQTDVALHVGTFRQPWQVAVVIGPVELRVFGRRGSRLVPLAVQLQEGVPA